MTDENAKVEVTCIVCKRQFLMSRKLFAEIAYDLYGVRCSDCWGKED